MIENTSFSPGDSPPGDFVDGAEFAKIVEFPIFVVEISTRKVVFANRAFYDFFFGGALDSITLRQIFARIDPDEVSWVLRHIELCAAGRTVQETHRVLNHAGRLRKMFWKSSPLRDRDLENGLVVCTAVDLTEADGNDDFLRHHDARWHSLIKNIPGYLLLTDGSGNIIFSNQSDTERRQRDLQSQNVFEQIAPHEVERAKSAFQTAWNECRTVEIDVEAFDESGAPAWYKSRLSPIQDNGVSVGMISFSWVMSETKIAQIQLSGHNRILERITRGDSLAEIFEEICALASRLVPGALGTVLLLSGDGRRVQDVHATSLHPDYATTVRGIEFGPNSGSCGRSASTGKIVVTADIETDPYWNDYRDFAARFDVRACWSIPFTSLNGQVLGTFAVYFRVPGVPRGTQLQLVENLARLLSIAVESHGGRELLEKNEARYRAMLEYSADALMTLDAEGIVSYDSPNSGHLLGYAPGFFTGTSFFELIHPEDQTRGREHYQRILAHPGRSTEQIQLRARHANGDWRLLELSASNFLDDATLNAVILNWRDVTRRAAVEEQLRRKQLELSHAARLSTLGEMVAGISHEVNQPLYAIKNYGTALLTKLQDDRRPDAPKIHDWLQQILKQAERAGEILMRLRSFSKKSPAKSVSFYPNEIARDAVKFLDSDPRTRGRRVELELEPGLPALLGDRILLQQVVINLLQNAFDASPDEDAEEYTVRLRTMVLEQDVVFEVVDRGRGISAEEAGLVFDPFYTTKEHGMGLGLTICRSIIESLRGQLITRNNVDGGCTFACRIPIPPAESLS